jgi:spore coat polysaccharide biosynthesis protein SpsF
MGSSRLPGKVMAEIEGKPMTWHIVNRLRHAKSLQNVVIAVPDGSRDEPIRQMARDELIPYFAGSETDLIDRIYKTAIEFEADAIVHITGDCPLADPAVIDILVKTYLDKAKDLDYVTNGRPQTFPHGLDVDVHGLATLARLWHEIRDLYYREWFPVYLWEHEMEFRTYNVRHSKDLCRLRWTVDYKEDLIFVREIYRRLYQGGRVFGMEDILAAIEVEPELATINSHRVSN